MTRRERKPTKLLMEETILDCLVPGTHERFELPEVALARLALRLEEVVHDSNAETEVEEAIRLAVALEETLASPTAAERLRVLLRSEPGVQDVLRALSRDSSSIDVYRGFLASEGRAAAVRAPDVQAPAGFGLRIRDFLNPGEGEAIRVNRGEDHGATDH